ncbi:hypothetical protein [Anabaena sp. CA = ATCC 33047]|nr:hypothetical protein [Anabaena sp. CA = ATCC 33047]
MYIATIVAKIKSEIKKAIALRQEKCDRLLGGRFTPSPFVQPR